MKERNSCWFKSYRIVCQTWEAVLWHGHVWLQMEWAHWCLFTMWLLTEVKSWILMCKDLYLLITWCQIWCKWLCPSRGRRMRKEKEKKKKKNILQFQSQSPDRNFNRWSSISVPEGSCNKVLAKHNQGETPTSGDDHGLQGGIKNWNYISNYIIYPNTYSLWNWLYTGKNS